LVDPEIFTRTTTIEASRYRLCQRLVERQGHGIGGSSADLGDAVAPSPKPPTPFPLSA